MLESQQEVVPKKEHEGANDFSNPVTRAQTLKVYPQGCAMYCAFVCACALA